MSQKPKMKSYLVPGSIGLTSPVPYIFLAIIVEPASPNPKARSPPIFPSVYSRT